LRRLLAVVVALNLLVFAFIGIALWRSLSQTHEDTGVTAATLSRVLEQSLSRFFDKVDMTLMSVADEIERQEKAGGIDRAKLEAFIARADSRLPEALGVRVVNAEGMVEYAVSNVITSTSSVADREHFLRHRDNPNLKLTLSGPIFGRLNHQPILVAARRRNAPDGSFAGIVHVAIAVSALQSMFAEVDLGPSGSVGLWSDDARLLARYSRVEPETATAAPSDTLRQLITDRKQAAAYHARSRVDGIERTFFFRQIGNRPFYTVVGIADSDALADWHQEVRLLTGLAAIFLLSSAWAAFVIGRGMMALDNSRADAEAARRRADLVLASAGEGICGMDAKGHVVFANRMARQLLGWGEQQVEGWHFHTVAHHHHADGSPYAGQDCPADQLAHAAHPVTCHVENEVYWRLDGTSFPVEYTVAPIVEGGRLAGMVNIFRDVSERKHTEDSLILSQQRARALLNAPTDAAFLLDRDGIVLACNEAMAQRFGCTTDELVGHAFDFMLPPDLAAARRAAFQHVLDSGQPLEFHDERNGKALDNRLYPILGADGRTVQVAAYSRDVTEQRQAASAMDKALAELARSNEELQQFAYVASHDLRQPLRMVNSYLNLIERRLGEHLDGEIKEFMDFATDGAQRMDRMIVDLLEYSRVGRGSAPFAPTPMGAVLSEAVLNLQVAIGETDTAIDIAPDLPTVMGERSELIRLFQNLLGNAVKYRSPDRPPHIQVGWRAEGSQMVIWVRDNGIGIAEADHDRAFRIFQRLIPGSQCEGSGIGLAVCRKIIDHHGGRIWIESTVGEGSTFLVALPAAR
jgi:PAS domain S-box-containing protein